MTYFLDLFAGIGGFALGAYLARLRFNAHYFSEVDDYAISVYQKRFPDAIGLGDIRGINGSDLPQGDWIIAGGFPCQDISVAGKGAGLEGRRSGLWFEYARLVGELRPRFCVMENSSALAFRGLNDVLGSLALCGYDSEWMPVLATDVGAEHERERLYIVAYPDCELGETRIWGIEERAQPIQPKNHRQGVIDWADEYRPLPGRVAHGVPHRVDRVKCLGNAIVPQIAELIFEQPAFDEWRCA